MRWRDTNPLQVGARLLASALTAAAATGVLMVCSAAARAETATAQRQTATIAVAANFAEVMERIEADFEADRGDVLKVTTGSTGQLYAQISHGAPYDVLLAADQRRPKLLVKGGLAVKGSRFSYAIGRLALWSAEPERIHGDGSSVLRSGDFRRLAIANPDLAPYGAAAVQVLRALDVYDALSARLVLGENVSQTYAMVASGNAELGLVALSYVDSPRSAHRGSRWEVPQSLYEPIRQDAVLLSRAEDNSTARDLLAYLRRPDVEALIRGFGYGID